MSNTQHSVIRSSLGLRDALFDELDKLRKNEVDPAHANATSRLADQICNTVQLELDVYRFSKQDNKLGINAKLPEPLELGKVA